MGGVDLQDSLIALYQTKIRSKKWYHRIVFHMMDFTLVQAWLLYRGDCRDCGIQKKEQLSYTLPVCVYFLGGGTAARVPHTEGRIAVVSSATWRSFTASTSRGSAPAVASRGSAPAITSRGSVPAIALTLSE
ncbi:UNVERIFIED_CONTAM: hypothetical protein FKN15_038609 [Acipenser sinensis]